MNRIATVCMALVVGLWAAVAADSIRAPKIWDDAALADWATPVAGLNVRPAHYSSDEYYAAPIENLRTYPVYHPDSEPAGYWDWLNKQKPEPLLDVKTLHTRADWIAAGERAFRDLDNPLVRTNEPSVMALVRNNPEAFAGVFKLPDGTVFEPRWVVTNQGVMVAMTACSGCHVSVDADNRLTIAGPGGPLPGAAASLAVRGLSLRAPVGTLRLFQRFYIGDQPLTGAWREWTVPWEPDERIERMRSGNLEAAAGLRVVSRSFDAGVFARTNGSPFHSTKTMDLQNLHYSRYLDATGAMRLRGPEDVARYAALVTGADRMDFGPHHILTDEQRHVRFRYPDEVLYAIGLYLMSLEPPKNPDVAPREILVKGEKIFRREGCVNCHVPSNYTSGKLTLAQGFELPPDHPNRADVLPISVGTDPGAALKTRKGTGFYKIPSLRGVWYRRLLLHDGAVSSLEEMFDPARLSPRPDSRGGAYAKLLRPPVPGHLFGLSLPPDEKAALLAFLRSL